MSDVESQLRSRVESFVGELSELLRRQALAAVGERLAQGLSEGEGPSSALASRAGRRPAAPAATEKAGRTAGRAAARVLPPAKRAPMGAPPPSLRPGEKRTPRALDQITEQLFNYINSNAGQSIEQIATSLAASTKELSLPIRKLLGGQRIGSKGQKRATRYFPR